MTLEPSAALLDGKAAVVTGGGGGIGRGMAEAFAAYGAQVVVAEIDADRAHETEAAIKSAGGDAVASVTDVREADQVAELVDTTIRRFDRVDVLVNNVGHYVIRGGADFVDTSADDWDALYAST